jgi:N-methylhydantoinase B
MDNVEQIEQNIPVLYPYRRELADSGGAGEFRGGNAGVFAVVAHGVDDIYHAPSSAGCAVPTSLGLSGGHPASTNTLRMKRKADVSTQFAQSGIPQDVDTLAGEEQLIEPKERGLIQHGNDVWEVAWSAGGGFGDPTERDPVLVLADINAGRVTQDVAETVYCVPLGDRGGALAIDDSATTELRRAERASRLVRARRWADMKEA